MTLAPDPKTAKLDPLFGRQFEAFRNAAWERHRIRVTINSGYRSPLEQARLYNAYLNGTGNPANRPGTSQHERGCAVDINPDCNQQPLLRRLLPDYGLILTYGHEPWHIEPAWTRTNTRALFEQRFGTTPAPEEDDMAAPSFQTDKQASDFITAIVRANVADILHHHRAAMVDEIARAVAETKTSDATTDVNMEKVIYAWLKPIAEKVGAPLPPFSVNPPAE